MSETKWRVMIVDDEPLAIEGIRTRLESIGGFDIIATATTGRSAITAVRAHKPDLLFLDIQMPGLGGFDVVEELGGDLTAELIFVTAFDQHALRALEARALAYLLKPLDEERFERAVEHARTRLQDKRDGALGRKLVDVLEQSGRAVAATALTAPERLSVRDGHRTILLGPDEIDWVRADGDYVRLFTSGKSYLVRDTMSRLETALPKTHFVRIHRSLIVNLARVRQVQPQANKELLVTLRDGTKLTASRGYADRLRAAIGEAK